jgi:hypothetical protein
MGQTSMRPSSDTDKGGLLSSLDAPLALGGTARPAMRVELNGSQPPPTRLVSARPDVLSTDGTRITGRAQGMSAVLVTTEDGTVLDFVHVWVRRADRIELHVLGADGSDVGELTDPYELAVGESLRVLPRLYAGSQPLSGVSSVKWAIDERVASVLSEGVPQRCRVLARAPGTATLQVSMMGASASLPIRVVR